MAKKQCFSMPIPPRRCELGSNPVKLCHEISRLTVARVRCANIEGIMSQHGARLVLASLAANDGSTQRAIVEATHLRPPTVSVLLRRMESEGMVELRENPKDRRELCAHLTDYGKEIDSKAIEKIKESDAIALEGFSESEIETLMALLSRVRGNLIASLSQKDCRRERGEEE